MKMTKYSILSIIASLFAATLSTDVCCKEDSNQKQYSNIFSIDTWVFEHTEDACNPYPECELWPDHRDNKNHLLKSLPIRGEQLERMVLAKPSEID